MISEERQGQPTVIFKAEHREEETDLACNPARRRRLRRRERESGRQVELADWSLSDAFETNPCSGQPWPLGQSHPASVQW